MRSHFFFHLAKDLPHSRSEMNICAEKDQRREGKKKRKKEVRKEGPYKGKNERRRNRMAEPTANLLTNACLALNFSYEMKTFLLA